MNSSKVFNCPLCSNKFSSDKKVPLTLPCGHVICKLCLINIKNSSKGYECPLDHIKINNEISSLPICQTILQFLPFKPDEQKIFKCNCSSKKSIKYLCTYDGEFFCSNCIKNHKNSPHKILCSIPNKNTILNEVNLIKANLSDSSIEIKERLKYLSEMKICLIDKTKEEITKLNNEINSVITNILNYKKLLEDKIKEFYNLQNQQVEKFKEKFNNQKELLSNLEINIKNINDKFTNENSLIYSEMIDEKNKIISDWEFLLKNNESLKSAFINKNNIFKLPIIKYQGKSHNILNQIAMMDFIPYKDNKVNNVNNEQDNLIQHYQSDSTRENTRKSHISTDKYTNKRKCSEPSNKNINRRFYDIKDKPILVNDKNNYESIINNLRVDNQIEKDLNNNNKTSYNKNVKLSYSH